MINVNLYEMESSSCRVCHLMNQPVELISYESFVEAIYLQIQSLFQLKNNSGKYTYCNTFITPILLQQQGERTHIAR